MKRSTFFLVLLAVTGIGLVSRHAVSGGANAGIAPTPQPRADRLTGLDRAHRVADEGAISYVKATLAAPPEPEGMALARAAANQGTRLLQRGAGTASGRILADATAHLKACLAFEPVHRGDPLFTEAREKLARIEALLSRPVTLHTPRLHVLPPDTSKRTATVWGPKPTSAQAVMVGPNGVIFKREQ